MLRGGIETTSKENTWKHKLKCKMHISFDPGVPEIYVKIIRTRNDYNDINFSIVVIQNGNIMNIYQ